MSSLSCSTLLLMPDSSATLTQLFYTIPSFPLLVMTQLLALGSVNIDYQTQSSAPFSSWSTTDKGFLHH